MAASDRLSSILLPRSVTRVEATSSTISSSVFAFERTAPQADCGTHALSEAASEAVTLKLFTSAVKRFFYVPAGSAGFALTVKDGGETEVAKVTVTSPSGRVALSRDGNWDATPTPLAVAPGEDGKVWRPTISVRQALATRPKQKH